jgi:hypothetical protein
MQMAIEQLSSYALWQWAIFVLAAVVLPLFGAGVGLMAAHDVIAGAVVVFDTTAAGDPDIVFAVGVVMRIALINALLLVVTVPCCLVSRRCRFPLNDAPVNPADRSE